MAKGDVETYWENGRWSTRRIGIADPFIESGSSSREEMIEKGRRDAVLYGVAHLIRQKDGSVAIDIPAQESSHRLPFSV